MTQISLSMKHKQTHTHLRLPGGNWVGEEMDQEFGISR